MRTVDKRSKVSRRSVLGVGTASLVALTVMPSGIIIGGGNAWAANAKALKAESFATLIQMARDIYPHDHVADIYYAKVVASFDSAAAKSDSDKEVFEGGVAALNTAAVGAHGVSYNKVSWEVQRVGILRAMEKSPFFQRVRGSLITGLYNNPDVWPLFGYEGESASKGGYINRGFDDIDWL